SVRPATTMSKVARSSSSWVGKATHWPSTCATRVAPTGPLNGRPDSWVDSDAALIATTSYGCCGSSARIVSTTWTSLRRPLTKVGVLRWVPRVVCSVMGKVCSFGRGYDLGGASGRPVFDRSPRDRRGSEGHYRGPVHCGGAGLPCP